MARNSDTAPDPRQTPPREFDPAAVKYFRGDVFPPNSQVERDISGLVLRRGAMTQAQISRAINRPQQTVSRLLSRLVERGMLRPGERVSSGKRGQLSVKIEIVPDYAYSFGISILWEALAVTLMNFGGEVLGSRQRAMATMSHDSVVAELRRMIGELKADCSLDADRIFAAGAGIPGTFMRETGKVNTPLILEEWANINLEEALADDLELPVWVENDGNAAAIGESLFGVGRRAADFIYLYIDTGIGGGVIHDGRLVRGAFGNAGEIGQLLPPQIYPHPNLKLLRELVCREGIEVDSVSELIGKFEPDWPGVDDWIARSRDSLSLIASAGAALLDPAAIVIGGRIPQALVRKVIPHIEIYDQRRRSFERPLPPIVTAEAGGESVSVGAAALPFSKYAFR
ncbi:MAG: ROK family transcriptional regulator [Gammaproteobacteria bacterium]|nr:ROK family transcriptional regulator [Gammaproteobacteria bacterium]MDE0479034.1 ROK family transcriptional regulator [Gammaproteobacteria bacterium]MDE0507937.1 ROK family transcriptional regulator [Gammaproteobacteria bacterium]MXY91466.1 ROK family transcriptional regulator [Gammaproteobacteria bacterium]MYA37276.1 ROK family transcriptional regulator [Gammaproteobacteria bacterium]